MYIKSALKFSIFSFALIFSAKAGEIIDQLALPACTTAITTPSRPVEAIMQYALRKYDPTSQKIELKKVASMTAGEIMVSDKLVARLSCKEDHAVEAIALYNLVQKLNLKPSSEDKLGFTLCLPTSIIFVKKDKPPLILQSRVASIVIMPKAQGRALYEYIAAGNRDGTLGRLFNELGNSLATFQMNFMEKVGDVYYTAAHGDFHEGNIFCSPRAAAFRDERLWSFSLIDCGTMDTKKMHLLMDPLYFLCRTAHCLSKYSFTETSVTSLMNEFYKGYLGYLSRSVVEFLKPVLPRGRSIAQQEENRMNSILFIDPHSESAQRFLSSFDRMNNEAFKPVLEKLLASPQVRKCRQC
jgi:hypothetical protein